jgi:WD40 repeat protein
VRLWDTETETCIHTFVGHTEAVISVAFSPQGDLISSVGRDKTVRLWDARSGACRYTYEGHTGHVYENVFSPNGKQIASCGDDRTVRLWNVETGGCDFILKGHQQYVFKVQFSPQGDLIASSGGGGVARLWGDTQTGECRQILIGHQGTVTSITFSPQGDQIASGCRPGAVRLWDLRAGSCTRTSINHKGQVNKIVYSPQGSLVASVSDDTSVRIWDPVSGKCRAAIEDLQDKVRDIDWAVISDIHHLVTGCPKGRVQMWRLTEDGDQCSLSLLWSAMSGTHILDVAGSKIQDVRGLISLNERLLKQRGAVGEPINRQGEAVKKLTSMASAMSKFKAPTDRAVDYPSAATKVSMEDLALKLEQAKDHLRNIEGMMTTFARDTHGHE